MEAYLDNAATTCPFIQVRQAVAEAMETGWGNPSSMHKKGIDAEAYIRKAREVIGASLKVDGKEIIFTSGGTESNNMALIGTALANQRRGRHIVTTCIEHPSVYNPMAFLEEEGFGVTYLPVDRNGRVSVEQLTDAIGEDTILLSVMHVNNEIGAVEPIEEIGKRAKAKNPSLLFHVDAIQSYGKYKIFPKRMGIDLLSASGHKIHGPKGIGFLYAADRIKMKPIIFGGEQQKGMRSGTENVPGIAGLCAAVKGIYEGHKEKMDTLYQLKEAFINQILELEGTTVNGFSGLPLEESAPHIVSVSFFQVKSEVLLHALEEKGIYVSAGSACASNHPGISGTLKAVGVDKKLLDSTLRFSFSVFTTMEEIQYTIQALQELLPILRKYTRH